MMTQRIFDVENEKDMADLWDIFPTDTHKIELGKENNFYLYNGTCFIACISCDVIKINWHDKTEIKRPIQEATKADIGKLCYFWDNKEESYIGILIDITNMSCATYYTMGSPACGDLDFLHCRRLTKTEIEELI